MVKANKIIAVMCLAVLSLWGQAYASNISVGDLTDDAAAEATAPTAGGVTNPTPLPVFVDGDGVTLGVQFRINYDPLLFTVVAAPLAGATCNVAPPGTVVVIYNDAGGNPIPAGQLNLCDLTVTALAQPASLQVFDVNLGGGGDGCFDVAFNPTVCNVFDAQIDVVAGPVLAPEIDVTPNPVNFNGGVGVNIDQVVTISNATGTDVLTVNALNVNGAIFSLVGAPAVPFNIAAGASQNITVRCNNPVAAAAVAGTLNVINNDADEADVLVNLSCTTNAAPIAATVNPAAINIVGPPTTLTNGATTVGNSAASGGPLDITGCITSDPAFIIAAPPGDFSVAVGGNQQVTIACVTPVAGAPAVLGTLTCQTNAASINGGPVGVNPNLVVDLSCSSAVAQPVPAVSSMGKILLASLVIGLGLLGIGLRRQA